LPAVGGGVEAIHPRLPLTRDRLPLVNAGKALSGSRQPFSCRGLPLSGFRLPPVEPWLPLSRPQLSLSRFWKTLSQSRLPAVEVGVEAVGGGKAAAKDGGRLSLEIPSPIRKTKTPRRETRGFQRESKSR